jgi:peptidoglycan-N-acetylglucosamine deacetylase
VKHRVAITITLVFIVALTVLYRQQSFYWPVLAGIVVAFSLLVTFGSYYIRFNYFITSVNRANGNKQAITLTFDDGPDEQYTLQVAELLQQENISATFFLIGHTAEKHTDIVKALHAKGHIIGNHSYSHRNILPGLTTRQLKADLQRCSEIIENCIGKKAHWFRPPFGVTTPRYGRVLSMLGMISVGWSLRSMDTITANPDRLYARIIKQLKPGRVVLLHDTQKATLQILPRLIEYCRTNGIKIVSLQELTDLQPYGDL